MRLVSCISLAAVLCHLSPVSLSLSLLLISMHISSRPMWTYLPFGPSLPFTVSLPVPLPSLKRPPLPVQFIHSFLRLSKHSLLSFSSHLILSYLVFSCISHSRGCSWGACSLPHSQHLLRLAGHLLWDGETQVWHHWLLHCQHGRSVSAFMIWFDLILLCLTRY